jgi:hypothetical protein
MRHESTNRNARMTPKSEFVKRRERERTTWGRVREGVKQIFTKGAMMMFRKNKTGTIPFREFMAGNHRTRKEASRTKNVCAMSAFFPTITPGSFFPVHDVGFALFLAGGAAIAGSALLQHMAAKAGSPAISEVISSVSGFIFPVVVYGAVFWFFFSL